MDIDDILASVSSGPAVSPETRDLQLLTRCWVAERSAPEVLPFPAELVERTMGRIRQQIEKIEELTGNMDPKTNFPLIVIQTELERFKFLVRSLVRARIAKIDKFPHHYLALATENPGLLSQTELQYLTHHTALLGKHYEASFLNQFPASLRKLDDTAGGISMVDRPDADTAVFVRVLRDEAGAVTVPGEREDGVVELKRGDIWVLRWSGVKELVLRGLVELV